MRKAKVKSAGRLFALDGISGRELERAAERLLKLCGGQQHDAACSRWDASNTFFELRMRKSKGLCLPVRTLLLLYASDLLFRLRWEIRPAMAEGGTLVAAPYVETAIAFGLAAGLPQDWLEELFSFAPKPDACFRVKEKGKTKNKKGVPEFVAFCCNLLAASSPGADPGELRAEVLRQLNVREDQGKLQRLGKKLPKPTT